MRAKILQYLKDDSGQTSTEYILLLAVVAMIIFKFKGVADEKITTLTNSVFQKAEGLLDSTE